MNTGSMSERVQGLKLEATERPGGRRKHTGRWLVFLLVLITGGAGGGWWYCKRHGIHLLNRPGDVETFEVKYEPPFDVILDATGFLEAPVRGKVSPKIPGTVIEVLADEGQKVQKDQVLVRLDDRQYRADLDQAQAVMRQSQARLDEVKRGPGEEEIGKAEAALKQGRARRDLLAKEFARAQELRDTISDSEFDKSETTLKEAEANVEQLEQALKLVKRGPSDESVAALEADLDRTKALVAKAQFFFDGTLIRAPMDGVILTCPVRVGQIVLPESINSTVCEIANFARLEAEFDVQERDLSMIRIGQPCLITPEAFAQQDYHAELSWMAPSLNRARGVRQARVLITDADERLFPGMNCRVRVLSGPPKTETPEPMKIPQEAVVHEGDRTMVWVVESEVARRRYVTVRELADDMVEVIAGLEGREIIVVPGTSVHRDGQLVRPKMRVSRESSRLANRAR